MKFSWQILDSGILISEKKSLLGKPKPPSQWLAIADPKLTRALSETTRLADEANCSGFEREERSDGLFLGHGVVAALSEDCAKALDLPATTVLGLRLETKGQLFDENFVVEHRWIRFGGLPVLTKVDGSIITYEGRPFRISGDLYRLLNASKALSQPLLKEDRISRYAELKAALDEATGADISPDGYIEQVTVYQAAAFSLELGISEDAFDFNPVLFGRQVADDAIEGEPVDETSGALLPQYYQRIFVDRFMGSSEARPSYALEGGSFVLIEPALRDVFSVVRRAASADRDTRREFISNPTGFIGAALPDLDPDALDGIFVETEQYSERVTGIDIWRQPVLPWLKNQPNTWLPEKFGLKIGDGEPIEVLPSEVGDLKAAFSEAEEQGRRVLDWKGVHLPVTSKTREAIGLLDDLTVALPELEGSEQLPVEDGAAEGGEEKARQILLDKRFLTVSDNLEELAYQLEAPTNAGDIRVPDKPPETVLATLKTYQKTGFQWLVASRLSGSPGVLLADDMGLGKTLQTLSFLCWLRASSDDARDRPILIVAPTGLLANWKAEIRKHLKTDALGEIVDAYGAKLKDLRLGDTHGSEISIGQTILDTASWQTAGVVLTTYETMRDFHFSFAKVQFSTLLFDEVQKLKNPSSQVSRAARSLNAAFKIGMSGTPVENRMQDVWSIMDVLWPGLLGSSRAFENEYPSDDREKLEELHSRLFKSNGDRPAIGLRRLKSDELDGLPEKHEIIDRVDMPPEQAAAYGKVAAAAYKMREDTLAPGAMLKILQDLRGISLHPEAPSSGYEDMDGYVARSARLTSVVNRLKYIQSKGEKALVFLESLEMQNFLADFLFKKFALNKRPNCISGKVAGIRRQEYVDTFQNAPAGFDVLILSPKAGGVGLTITAANHVIHLSRWWNPAIEDQSTDRAFRIGQEKPVHVFIPLAVHPSAVLGEHSFDITLDNMLRRKRALAGSMLLPPEDKAADAGSLLDGILGLVEEEQTETATTYAGDTAATNTEVQDAEDEGVSHIPPDSIAEAPETLDEKVAEKKQERRPVLSLKKQPPEELEEFQDDLKSLFYKEGVLPDPDEVFAGLEGWEIVQLKLIDPYTIWRHDGLKALATIVKEVMLRAKSVETVRLEFYPPQCVDGRAFELASIPMQQIRGVAAQIAERFKRTNPRMTHFERRKSRNDDFHDRYIVIKAKYMGKILERTYDVPRGLDSFERAEYSAKIFITDRVISKAA